MDTLLEKVTRGNQIWIEAFKRQDADLLASAFHEDGAILGDGGRVILGRQAVRAAMAANMDRIGPSDFTIQTNDLYQIGADIYEKGQYTLKIADGTFYEGKFVVIWRYKEDGNLYFYRDIGV